MGARVTHSELLDMAPADLQYAVDSMTKAERQKAERYLEGIAYRAAGFAAYLGERCGHGCGDQGHERAVKAANKARKAVWCGAFGYNECPRLSF